MHSTGGLWFPSLFGGRGRGGGVVARRQPPRQMPSRWVFAASAPAASVPAASAPAPWPPLPRFLSLRPQSPPGPSMLPVSTTPDQLRRNRGLFHPTWSGIGGEASEWSGSGGGVWLSWELVNADDDCPRGCHLERPSAGAASFVLSTATTLSRVCGQQMRQNVVAVQAAPTSHTFRRICGEQTRESVWSVNSGPVELPKPKPWQIAVAPGNRCPRHAEPAVRCAEPLASQRFCMARGGIRPCRASSLAKLSSLLRSNRGSPSSQPSGRYKTAGRRCTPSPATFEFSHELQQTR